MMRYTPNLCGTCLLGSLSEPSDMPRVVFGFHATCRTSDCSEPVGFAFTNCDWTLPAPSAVANRVDKSGRAAVEFFSDVSTALRGVTLAPRAASCAIAVVSGAIEATTLLARLTAIGI